MSDITQTLPSHWKYVSEGGATIVFSYVGPPDPTYDGMVLRLRKAVNGSPEQEATGEDEPDDPVIEYQTRCMERVFPQENLPRLQSVRLERKWLKGLVEMHDFKRPEARRGKDHVDFSRKKGVLATDLVGGDWIAVEIKPKWAFLPSATHLSGDTKMAKTQTCRFCMHSYMRNVEDQKYVNNYCPLDLFSGNVGRVHKAIDSLWDAWEHSSGSVNNLKIFAHGKVVKPGQVERLVREDVVASTSPEKIREVFKEAVCNTLLRSPVLTIISRLQRSLDVLDIEGLSKLWREAELQSPLYRSAYASYFEQPVSSEKIPPATPLGVPSTHLPASEPTISDWVEFLDTFQSAGVAGMDHTQPRIENLRYYLLAYLLSATFKDCSIIVKLDFLGLENITEYKVHPIAVIDLDPKGLDRLQRWQELDRGIVYNYTPAERKVCVDGWAELSGVFD
ncbi:inositol-pentakisphosphate 2-kinase [Macrolepiota fuliginosa MF-IS2]|uniref:Inositol-pentakisphosphate 2-kinase n=1 Tax=Macrolepiota fuliginosa MF-IS2 TaxID=1400762 RepID=A0A9P6CA40_9AGAR|nr:inositol-pentakisphosphate 2-kinase [Macrolepiota fuliginosa MF-IS2]